MGNTFLRTSARFGALASGFTASILATSFTTSVVAVAAAAGVDASCTWGVTVVVVLVFPLVVRGVLALGIVRYSLQICRFSNGSNEFTSHIHFSRRIDKGQINWWR